MVEIKLYAVGMEEHGNESVTSMLKSIRFVNCVLKNGIIVPVDEVHHKLPLAEGGTHDRSNLIHFVNHVMQKFMESVEIIKMAKNIEFMNMIDKA